MDPFSFDGSPGPIAITGTVHGVQLQCGLEPRAVAVAAVGTAEGGAGGFQAGPVGAPDRAVLQPEVVGQRVLLDQRESCYAATELGSDPSDGSDDREVTVELLPRRQRRNESCCTP